MVSPCHMAENVRFPSERSGNRSFSLRMGHCLCASLLDITEESRGVARRFSARTPLDRNRALWGGFFLVAGGDEPMTDDQEERSRAGDADGDQRAASAGGDDRASRHNDAANQQQLQSHRV